jgi:hypothetical protein
MNIDLVASSESIQILSVAPIAWNNPALGFSGTPDVIDGASIIGLQAAQFSLIPPFTSTNPILVTTFTFVRTAPEASLTYSAEVAAGAPFPFSVTGPIFSDPVVEFGTDAFVSGRIPGIPSPAGVTGLTIAGLIGLRRRR